MQKGVLIIGLGLALLASGCTTTFKQAPVNSCQQLKRQMMYINTNPNREANSQAIVQREQLKQRIAECDCS